MLERKNTIPRFNSRARPRLRALLLALACGTTLAALSGCVSDPGSSAKGDATAAETASNAPAGNQGGFRAGTTDSVSLPEQAPEDFALSITVATPDPLRDPSTLARWQRPARYIVEPGGTFRASVRPGARVDAYPPPIRTLSRAQIETLWASVRADSWMSEARAGSKAVASPEVETMPPELQRRSALVWISAAGMRRGVVVPLAGGNAESDAAARLIDQLAELAWVRK
ncbi:MAG: hypothetical protein IT434_10660 [Phycisphaerales bacterium]|jgi:hypothetical protein|nr:hypothetical protein [Phycisphaerales bacterium]